MEESEQSPEAIGGSINFVSKKTGKQVTTYALYLTAEKWTQLKSATGTVTVDVIDPFSKPTSFMTISYNSDDFIVEYRMVAPDDNQG